jgi:precorrin-2 methylase
VISALTDFSPVGYVTYGNPLVYDSVSQHLVRFAKDSGTHLRIVAGLSSIDALLCDLGIDMAPGLQVLDATWAVAAKIVAQTDLALVLLQLGAFGSLRTHYQVMPPASALHDLITYLSGFYPSSHEVFLVQSADRAGHP